MIKNVIYVEDGSVDIDELQETFGEETKVIVYRQGSVKPIIEQLATPIETYDDVMRALEKAGYRKVEEVRKETAKEIYREIYLQSYADDKRLCPSVEVWENVLKKYGVEIEE